MRFTARDIGITIFDIIDTVADYFGIPGIIIQSEKRDKELVYARQLISYITLKAGFKPTEIARMIKMSHCNVWHMNIMIGNYRGIYPVIEGDIENINHMIILNKFRRGRA
jgi:chromosomal replication initiation ATPase DnaA